MTQMNAELQQVKFDVLDMWSLVINQLARARESVENFDKDLARVIKANEKRVDAYELKIDMECENLLALFNPVANDLRFTLACLKINYNLERIGDFAHGIAKGILEMEECLDKESLEKTKLFELFNITLMMMSDAMQSFDTENNKLARSVFKNDESVDQISKSINKTIAELIKAKTDRAENYLILSSDIKKLERVGDHTKNIAEEIIFYLEAKVLKHSKKK